MSYISKKGTISLETAISFSIVLIFITGIISVTAFLRTDILMQRAVKQSCDDLTHFMPFSTVAADTVSTLTNALPDTFSDDGTIERIGSVITGVDEFTSGELRSTCLNLMLGSRFADDVASEFAEYNSGSFWGPDEIYVDFDVYDYYIEVYVEYSVNTIIGPIRREIISTIPFYGDFELFLSPDGENTPEDTNDIWHQNNFVRGRYFAEKYGANLPHTFPTINFYNSGQAGSIVSIDLNRPTYSNPAACVIRVTEQIDELARFNGADVMINGSRYVVYGENIRQRTLIVVIPEDSPEANRAAIYSMSAYASASGVELQIVEDGTSG